MAFLSKILFKPNKVLEILSFVCIFLCNVEARHALTSHVPDISDSVIHRFRSCQVRTASCSLKLTSQ